MTAEDRQTFAMRVVAVVLFTAGASVVFWLAWIVWRMVRLMG